ncbi:MAG TPA: peptidylprolyl isomerase [Candidatus Limnocylindria bacterium]|nr:peptidylprolyl isomerase [Candidatus Limnocylindria bacterium]
MRILAVAAAAILASACGSTAAAPTATPIRTVPIARTAAPTIVCQGAPNQPSSKATITLEKGGTIVIQLRPDKAPRTVSNFAIRANTGRYDGLTFHRVEPGFVIQGGDPAGNGTGGSTQCTELSDLPFVKGAVGIARGPDINISNDYQFFICIGECRFLDGKYTNFGTVISGQDVADNVKIGDKIKSIRVE